MEKSSSEILGREIKYFWLAYNTTYGSTTEISLVRNWNELCSWPKHFTFEKFTNKDDLLKRMRSLSGDRIDLINLNGLSGIYRP